MMFSHYNEKDILLTIHTHFSDSLSEIYSGNTEPTSMKYINSNIQELTWDVTWGFHLTTMV